MINNPFDEINKALNEARSLQRAVRANADSMADLLDGNLENVSTYKLTRLKTQLRKFNMHTGRWKK